MALWAATAVCLQFGYNPPKRAGRFHHLSLYKKITHLDLPGYVLFAAGLTLFLVGMSLRSAQYTWTDRQVLAPLIVGIVILVGFALYEWRGTSVGFLHHGLFRGKMGRTFSICVGLIFFEGVLLFSYVAFFPLL